MLYAFVWGESFLCSALGMYTLPHVNTPIIAITYNVKNTDVSAPYWESRWEMRTCVYGKFELGSRKLTSRSEEEGTMVDLKSTSDFVSYLEGSYSHPCPAYLLGPHMSQSLMFQPNFEEYIFFNTMWRTFPCLFPVLGDFYFLLQGSPFLFHSYPFQK